MTFKEILVELRACELAIEWAGDKDIKTVLETCERGDWLLWLAKKLNVDHRKLTLAKARCAATVLHLMKDERSKKAVDVAEKYGLGFATKEELTAAADAAYVAADAAAYADASAAAAAAYAAYAAYASAADYAADYTADAASDAAYADAADDAARKENRLQTANICRELLATAILQLVEKHLNKKQI